MVEFLDPLRDQFDFPVPGRGGQERIGVRLDAGHRGPIADLAGSHQADGRGNAAADLHNVAGAAGGNKCEQKAPPQSARTRPRRYGRTPRRGHPPGEAPPQVIADDGSDGRELPSGSAPATPVIGYGLRQFSVRRSRRMSGISE